MKPAAFEYVPVHTVDDAISALVSSEESRVLAGGQSLVPLMNLRLARPSVVVDINDISDLEHVSVDPDRSELRLGALCRHRRLERDPQIRSSAPLLADAAALIGHPQIRNRGTLGGSLAHGDPAAELGAALIALEGRVRVVGPNGPREIAAGDLFVGFLTTSIEPHELLVEIVVPAANRNAGAAFVEYAPRYGDFAVVGVAAHVERDDGRCVAARVAACGVADTLVDLSEAVAPLIGADPTADDVLRSIADRVGAVVRPLADVHATADDRRELAQILTVQALRRAWAGTERGELMMRISCTVNGSPHELDLEPRELLIDVLRDRLDLRGVRAGCEQGACGTCTVLVDGRGVRSCLLFGVQLAGREVTTIEGVGSPADLHPIQRMLSQCQGLQCGFCTPGIVLSALELLRDDPSPTRDEIEEGMSGSLCRCTGYVPIVDAIAALAQTAETE